MTEDSRKLETGQPDDALMTTTEVAQLLGVPRGTIHFWVHERSLPHIRLGPRSVRFRRADILRWVDERSVATSKATNDRTPQERQ